jgi:hypothetical protein
MATVLEAAQKWADELANYIIDDAEKRGDDADARQYSAELDKVHAAIEELKGDRVPDPASKVSYDPCIQGTITVGGRVSEFMIPFDKPDIQYSQWGADNTILWPRTDLLEGMAAASREWRLDNPDEEDSAEDDYVVDALIQQGLAKEMDPDA